MKTAANKKESLYNVLGVSPDAGQAQIKSAYNSLVSDAETMDEASRTQRAYQVLGNKNMRMRYDNALASQPGTESANTFPDVTGGSGLVTVYTIDQHGNWFTEKRSRSELPTFDGNSAYILRLEEENVCAISKNLWNKWRDLCEIWQSKNVITDTIGNICLSVDLITMENGRLAQTKTLRKVSQLPLMFPNAVSETGEVYAYRDEGGDTAIIEEYDYIHLRRLMERQSRDYEYTEW